MREEASRSTELPVCLPPRFNIAEELSRIDYWNSRDEERQVEAEEEETEYLPENGSITPSEPTWIICRLQQLLLYLSGFTQHRGVDPATSSLNRSSHRWQREIGPQSVVDRTATLAGTSRDTT